MARALSEQALGEGEDVLVKRQRECEDPVPVYTRYENRTIATYYISYSQPPPESSTTSTSTEQEVYASEFTTEPEITYSAPRTTRTTSTSRNDDALRRAAYEIPITIPSTYVEVVPVETVFSCPPVSTSKEVSRNSSSIRTWAESATNSTTPTMNSTIPSIPDTSKILTNSSSVPPSSSTHPPRTSSVPPSTSTWHSPPTSPPPSTRPTRSIPPPTSWITTPTSSTTSEVPSTTLDPSQSMCAYTTFDHVYSTPCESIPITSVNSSSVSWPCSSYRDSWQEWVSVPCTSESTNTTFSIPPITSWPCSSFVDKWEEWVSVPCTSSSTNITSSIPPTSSWPCSSYASNREAWVPIPCTSTTPNSTSTIPPTTSWPCSTYIDSWEEWVSAPCTSSIPNITSSLPPTTSWPCSTYIASLQEWVGMPCTASLNSTPSTSVPTTTWPCSSYMPEWQEWIGVPCTSSTRTTSSSKTITSSSTTTSSSTITSSRAPLCSSRADSFEDWVTFPCTSIPSITSQTQPSITPTFISSAPCSSYINSLEMWVPCSEPSRTSGVTSRSSRSLSSTSNSRSSDIQSSNTVSRASNIVSRTSGATIPVSDATSRTSGFISHMSSGDTHISTPSRTRTNVNTVEPTSRASLGSSRELTSNTQFSIKETNSAPPSERPTSNAQTQATTRTQSSLTRSSPLPSTGSSLTPSSIVSFTSPSAVLIVTSAFTIPTESQPFLIPSPSSTSTVVSSGLHGSALAGAVIGGILGVVGLIGLGVFVMRSLGGARGIDLYSSQGQYERAPGGGTGPGSGPGGGTGGMAELRNEGPQRRSSLRYRGDGAGGDLGGLSWTPFAFAGAAAAGAATSGHQRGRGSDGSNANVRYADGGIRDEHTPDGGTGRYADGGLAGPDSQYDSGAGRAQGTGYQDYTGYQYAPTSYQDMGATGSGADGSFEPYRDLPLGGDGTAVGGGSVEGQGVNRDGTGGGLPTGSGGSDGFSPFNSLGAAVVSGGASDTNPRVTQGNNGPGLARSDAPNLAPGLNQQDSYGSRQDTPGGQQSAPGGDTGYNPPDPFDDLSHTSPSYTESTGASGVTSGGGSGQTGGDIASPNPHSAQSDLPLPRPPYWSWDAEPAIPAYTSAPSGTIAPGDAGMSSTVPYADHHADQMFLTSQANDLNINTSTAIVDVEAPDLPKGLHLGLERMGSPVARSRASSISHGASPFYKAGGVGPTVRPLNVRKSGGPRPQPSTSPRNEDLAQGSQGRFSVPPAYDERHEI